MILRMILVLMVDWDFHFAEHIIGRPGLPFYTRAGLTPTKQDVKFGIFYLIFQMFVYAFFSGEPFAFYGLGFELFILHHITA